MENRTVLSLLVKSIITLLPLSSTTSRQWLSFGVTLTILLIK